MAVRSKPVLLWSLGQLGVAAEAAAAAAVVVFNLEK